MNAVGRRCFSDFVPVGRGDSAAPQHHPGVISWDTYGRTKLGRATECVDDGNEAAHELSLRHVTTCVNTARINSAVTTSHMVDKRKAQGRRLKEARVAAGYRSAREAALGNGWNDGTYRTHEAGTRTMGQDDAERYASRFRARGVEVTAKSIMFEDGDEEWQMRADRIVSIMGRIGAGATIDTAFEQAPPEGFEQIELPYPIPEEFVGFRVLGDSMSPAYEPDGIVVVDRDPTNPDQLIGDAAAVVIVGASGEELRYLKRIRRRRDQPQGTFDLESINDRSPTLRDVRIKFAAPVRMIIPNIGLRRLSARANAAQIKAVKSNDKVPRK